MERIRDIRVYYPQPYGCASRFEIISQCLEREHCIVVVPECFYLCGGKRGKSVLEINSETLSFRNYLFCVLQGTGLGKGLLALKLVPKGGLTYLPPDQNQGTKAKNANNNLDNWYDVSGKLLESHCASLV